MGDTSADRDRDRDHGHDHGDGALTMAGPGRLPRRPGQALAPRCATGPEGPTTAPDAFAEAVNAGIHDDDRAIDTARADATSADRDRLGSFTAGLSSLPRAQAQLAALRAAAAADHAVVERVYVQFAGTHEGVEVAAGDLDGLVRVAERRVADLQVAGSGPAFAGLADLDVPAERIAALTTLGQRYRYGGGGTTSVDAMMADQQELARLTAELPRPIDALSAASLRQIGQAMSAAFAALQATLGPTIRADRGDGMSIEAFEARQRAMWEAGDQIRSGLFAGLFYTLGYATSDGDIDYAVQCAGLGAAIDGLTSTMAAVHEGRGARTEAAERGADRRTRPEATIVGIDGQEPPPRAEPVHAPEARDVSAPRGETRSGRRTRERATMERHADRLGRTRRR